MRFTRRRWLSGLASSSLAAPFIVRNAGATGLTKVVYQTAWVPEPDEGGLYQALTAGIYTSHGLDVEVRAGGPQLNAVEQFLAGKADFITIDSFRAAAMAAQGLPGVAVAAFYQKPPHVILSHPQAGNDTLADLRGKPILISDGDRQSFWMWLKAKYGYSDDQARPYTFNMAPFLVDKNLSMQGFITSEPYLAHQAGVDPVVHVLADHGYLAYYDIILAAPRMIAERKDVVARFVDATIKGWQSYLHGDPKPANDAIKTGNPGTTDDAIAYARGAMKRYGLFDSDDVKRGGLGAMSDAKWNGIYRSLAAVGALPKGVDIRKAYTLEFVNKRVGAA
jgi:NitT/TauT family transport system substrate-binding protein